MPQASMTAAVGSSGRWPSAMDHAMTALMRPLSLRAVSRRVCQTGPTTASTSSEVISETGMGSGQAAGTLSKPQRFRRLRYGSSWG